jgi:hypothetical protein
MSLWVWPSIPAKAPQCQLGVVEGWGWGSFCLSSRTQARPLKNNEVQVASRELRFSLAAGPSLYRSRLPPGAANDNQSGEGETPLLSDCAGPLPAGGTQGRARSGHRVYSASLTRDTGPSTWSLPLDLDLCPAPLSSALTQPRAFHGTLGRSEDSSVPPSSPHRAASASRLPM